MIDPVSDCLDMAVEHGAGAASSHPVPNPVSVQPFGSRFLSPANLIPHYRVENLGPAAGHGTKAGIAQNFESLRNRASERPAGPNGEFRSQ